MNNMLTCSIIRKPSSHDPRTKFTSRDLAEVGLCMRSVCHVLWLVIDG